MFAVFPLLLILFYLADLGPLHYGLCTHDRVLESRPDWRTPVTPQARHDSRFDHATRSRLKCGQAACATAGQRHRHHPRIRGRRVAEPLDVVYHLERCTRAAATRLLLCGARCAQCACGAGGGWSSSRARCTRAVPRCGIVSARGEACTARLEVLGEPTNLGGLRLDPHR